MEYENDPAGGPPAVVATAAEVNRCGRRIARALARYAVPSRDRPDLVQDALVVGIAAISARRVRGEYKRAPRDALRAYLDGVARKLAANYRALSCHRREVVGLENAGRILVTSDPISRLEARDELRRITGRRRGARNVDALLLAALGFTGRDGGEAIGRARSTFHARADRARKLLGELAPALSPAGRTPQNESRP